MKSTGIVRKIDDLGRIVLPVELRRILDIDKNSSLEIYSDADSIVLRKYTPACVFCGGNTEVISYEGRCICTACREAISKL